VRQRLQNNARQTSRPFQEVLQYYAMERFLYRLSQSTHAGRFVLKGALMLTAWKAPASRPTRDIDLLARMENTVNAVLPVVRDVCGQAVQADGLVFDVEGMAGAVIKEDADYAGVRVTFQAYLQNARVPMQIDVGFGDVIVPDAAVMAYPTILDYPAPTLRTYSRETTIAEKFEAMVKLGQLNSRMKDFYDIWLLARQFDFDGATLATAISRTFANRRTALTENPVALTTAFADDPAKAAQWRGFLRKSRLDHAPAKLKEVTEAIRTFLVPVTAAQRQGQAFEQQWNAPGPWQGK
jgi:predicted nucleotidyltransferase component of viral defense system